MPACNNAHTVNNNIDNNNTTTYNNNNNNKKNNNNNNKNSNNNNNNIRMCLVSIFLDWLVLLLANSSIEVKFII